MQLNNNVAAAVAIGEFPYYPWTSMYTYPVIKFDTPCMAIKFIINLKRLSFNRACLLRMASTPPNLIYK